MPEWWWVLAAFGWAGLGLGIGLVIGAFTARLLRRIVEGGKDDGNP